MEISEDSTLADLDADAALAAAKKVANGGIHLCIEYSSEEFQTLYADELTMSMYGDECEEMRDHFEEVHSYVHIDFTERDLFSELFRGAGNVRSFVTYMDHVVLVRVLVGQQGLFLTTDPDADVTALVEAIESELE